MSTETGRDNLGRFAEGNPGKPKGAICRHTRLKNDIMDALQEAANSYQKGMAVKEYLGQVCLANPIEFLRIAANLLPKEITGKHQFDFTGGFELPKPERDDIAARFRELVGKN